MAKSFKEIGKKAEALIEQGNEAERKVQSCQGRVASANNRVAMARAQLAAARETDEEGKPKGDVQQAQVQLSMAQNQLAASQRALSAAKSDVAKVNQEKQSHVQTIEQHNKVERSNLQKLRRIRGSAFSQDSAAITRGMAERLNSAEKSRVALLRSMGIDATAEYVPIDEDGTSGNLWTAGGFSALDLSGEIQNYQGGSSITAGGMIGQTQIPPSQVSEADVQLESPVVSPRGEASSETFVPSETETDDVNPYINYIEKIWTDPSLSTAERVAALKDLQNQLLRMAQQEALYKNYQFKKENIKVLKLTDTQRYEMGINYIDNILEVYRDNLRDRGISDGAAMEKSMMELRAQYLNMLSEDIRNGTYFFDSHPLPDFDALAEKVRSDYALLPPQYAINSQQRKKIREGIRKGIVTEKDIRAIGRNLRERYDGLITEKHQAYEEIRKQQNALALQMKYAKTPAEREKVEAQRRILMQLEKTYTEKFDTTSMVREVLSAYRPIGPGEKTHAQPYLTKPMSFGSSKVIKALDRVRDYLPTDWVEKSNEKPIRVSHVSRGYFIPGSNYDEIALSGQESHMKSCGFHEMGHRIENMYPEVLEIERQFYNRRTAGYDLEWLGPGYDQREVSRKDNFINAYMGKDYGGSGYELLSMGLESLFCDTYNLSRDTEYEDLILGILAAI